MSRYIDADAYKNVFEKLNHRGIFPQSRDVIILRNYLDEFPTADVVEVVRCKDCKHYVKACFDWHDDDDFCSHGERREDD